ncbi:major facilitator superfamily transporter multidrug resistance [Bisporella sp. PMI_857]|nr:major facilitator superfamily transporter multidrug resistance [Bisporella sp. PMI_857]
MLFTSRPSWADIPRRISRRFTTLEGFREISGLWDGTTPNENTDDVGMDNRVSIPLEPPYHVFSYKEKWLVVAIIGVAGLFSGLSSNIYFPALDTVARDLNVSLNSVSLTITSYLIIQGVSPLFWGSLSDTIGRRQIYIYSFLVYIIANIGLSFSPNFIVLLIFRGVQAAGSASTVSIVRNFSIAIGPVLGGLISNFLGFRPIFIFLLALSTLTLIMIIIFLPETLRTIAGNGTFRLTGIHEPLIRRFRKAPPYVVDREQPYTSPQITARIFVEPLLLLKEKDILLSLIFGGTVYAIWSMVTSSTTGLFKESFRLNEVFLGLAFIPNGLGTIVGSTIIGNLMNRSYIEAEKAYKQRNSLPSTYTLPKKSLPADFQIEHARLKHMKWIVPLFILSTALYGFSLAFPAFTSRLGWIAIPLLLQFLIAATSNAVFAINQTMVSDLCPGKGASSTAINNLVRCSMGAVGVSLIEQMIILMGSGGAFLGLAFITMAVTPLVVVQWYWGGRWRMARMERIERKNVAQKDIGF